VRVDAAAITRDELDWPVDRLPAIPSYELSGTLVATGEEVFALTGFDRDGVAAEYAVVPTSVLAPKPRSLGHVASAAVPLAGLSAWQALFEHGRLEAGERVLIHGAAGGVGSFATQLAQWRGAYVIGTASRPEQALGIDEVLDYASVEDAVRGVDLVFDTVGGDVLVRSAASLRPGARLVSVAEEPPALGTYFVVEPNRAQLVELARLADEGLLRPAIDSVFPLAEARAAFERLAARGKSGKVVLRLMDE
jgi:NADPH:quinone reductase-like Zn-dependent oxidoreductase